MSGNTLSDRILNAANDLKGKVLAHPYVSQMLLKGDAANGREVLTRAYKFLKDSHDDWTKLFEAAAKNAQTPEEKQFLEQLLGMFDIFIQRYETLFKAKFIDYDQNVLTNFGSREAIPNYHQSLAVALKSPILDLLVAFMALFYPARLIADLKFDPQFKPNWFYDFVIMDYNQVIGLLTAIKSLIDNRGTGISGQEEQRLIQGFRIGFETQITLLDLYWKGKK